MVRSWAATVAALPVGARVAGEVIGRQRFGVFIHLDGVPNAVALAEVTAMPHEMELPALGARVEGEVLWACRAQPSGEDQARGVGDVCRVIVSGRLWAVRGPSAGTNNDNQ